MSVIIGRVPPLSMARCWRRQSTNINTNPAGAQRQAGGLHQQGADVARVAQPKMLFCESGRVPTDAIVGGEMKPVRSFRDCVRSDQDPEDHERLDRLEDRDRQALADLPGVVHAEPLVGRVTTPGDHELRTEQPADSPCCHEHRRDDVERLIVCRDGHLLRARISPVGTPPMRPPNEESPPFHTARICPGSLV